MHWFSFSTFSFIKFTKALLKTENLNNSKVLVLWIKIIEFITLPQHLIRIYDEITPLVLSGTHQLE